MLPQKRIKPSFYFLILIILVLSIFIFPVSGVTYEYVQGSYTSTTMSNYYDTYQRLRVHGTSQALFHDITVNEIEYVTTVNRLLEWSDSGTYPTGQPFYITDYSTSAYIGKGTCYISGRNASFVFSEWIPQTIDIARYDIIYNNSISIRTTNSGTWYYKAIYIPDGITFIEYATDRGSVRGSIFITYNESAIEPEAIIDVIPTSGTAPLYIELTDNSTELDILDDLHINWGDGDTYDNPFLQGAVYNHEYESAGTYEIEYAVTQGETEDIFTAYETVTVGSPAGYNFIIRIYNTSMIQIPGAIVNLSYYNGSVIQTDDTDWNGYARFTVPNYVQIYGNATAPGYQVTPFIINFGTLYNSFQIIYNPYETIGEMTYYGTLMLTTLDSSDSSTIDFVRIDVYDDVNRTHLIDTQYTDEGFWSLFEPMNQDLYYALSHPSYGTQYFTENITASPEYKTVFLTKMGLPEPTGGYNISITCIDASTNSYVNGAWFTASKTSNVYENYAAKTNSSGIAIIQHVPPGLYYLTSLYSGYYTNNQTVSITSSDISRTVYISPYTGTPIPTFTPVQTPVWTGEGGAPGNAIEGLYNFVMFLGIGQLAAGVLIGLCITCGCAIALAIFAGGTGAMLGACVGFIGCCVIGFFPIWLLFIAVILIFAVFFIFRSGSEE